MKSVIFVLIFSILLFVANAQASVVINEVLFDPYGAGDGDANGDGTTDFHSDEFIELMNTGSSSVDIGGWKFLSSQNVVIFTFPTGVTLAPNEICVVFGGVDPSTGFGSYFPADLQIFAAQQGIENGFEGGGRTNLYGSNENVILKNASDQAIAEVYWGTATAKTAVGVKFASPNTIDGESYSGTSINQSVSREPDGTGLWARHTTLSASLYYSPGAANSGEFYDSDYCLSHASGSSSYIDSFTVGEEEFTSGATTYSDYTGRTIYIAPGSDTYFKVHKADSASCYFTLWIDYNGDGDFNDVGEELFSRGPLTSYTSRTIPIPADVQVTTTRLRVAVKQAAASSPCDTGFTGEVEDYTVKFTSVVINEVLFDPYGAGDANGDGTIEFHSDEFIELLNLSGTAKNIGGWTLNNSSDAPIFTFPTGTTLQPGEICVVFGGVDPSAGFGSQFPPSLQIFAAQQAVDRGFEAGGSTNLLSSAENVVLRDELDQSVAEVYWGTASPITGIGEKFADPYTADGAAYYGTSVNQSVGRLPDGTGLWAKHSFLFSGAIYSPGKLNTDGTGSPHSEGYYKVLFMDGGVSLTGRVVLPAADYLSISMEHLATSEEDTQSFVMITNNDDSNGRLLYPDGEPRYRAIYTNGGQSSSHGTSLGEDGRNRVRDFYYNGGSFTGSCAGAFITSVHYLTTGTNDAYYHIWPGRTKGTGLFDTETGHFVASGSPLLNYYDFGTYIADVYHNGGCYARTDVDYPAGTEILLRYDYSPLAMHNDPSCWAYKEDSESGRLVVIGSHPESITGGERLQLMAAMIQYALDGQGSVTVKDTLSNGQARLMNKSTGDNDPTYTKIGDKQYHHFQVEIPSGASDLQIILDGDSGYDMNLYANSGNYAFKSVAEHKSTGSGSYKVVTIPAPAEGTWYIGVECTTTVNTEKFNWGYEYSGDLSVLDGVAYSIAASWN
ncbi:MAG: lamin tail domain-containing protein [Candidatus Aminicenantes bacterium]|nr:lamin tail domain-containing protein [Candidatus Aminicenantes bacterium]